MPFAFTRPLHHDTSSQQEESIFTPHRIHHFPVRQIAGRPPSSVSTCHLADRSGKMIWWQEPRRHFLVHWTQLRAPLNLRCSVSGTLLAGCPCEAKMSTSIPSVQQVRHINHLSVYRLPHQVNVARQKHAVNKDKGVVGRSVSCITSEWEVQKHPNC